MSTMSSCGTLGKLHIWSRYFCDQGQNLGSGTQKFPASTKGATEFARSTFEPLGFLGMMPGTVRERVSMSAGPLALSSTSFASASGHFAYITSKAFSVSVKLRCLASQSSRYTSAPRRARTPPATSSEESVFLNERSQLWIIVSNCFGSSPGM